VEDIKTYYISTVWDKKMNDNYFSRLFHCYKNSKVLVTGGAGFVGSNLVRKLLEFEADVTVLDDLFSGSEVNLKGMDDISFIRGDVRDKKLVDEIITSFDYVFHLAARNIIVSTQNPKEDFEVNIGGTLNLLLSLKKSKTIKKFIYTSSVSIYGNPKYLPINEDDTINLLSPYAVSKLGGENYTTVFFENFNLPTAIVRYSNVYGDFQTVTNPYCGVIGKFIECAISGKPVIIHGDGEQTRDFTYVEDAVDATLLAGVSERSTGEIFNIGTGIETSVNRLISLLELICKKQITIKHIDKRDIDNIRRRVVNIEKIRKKLRWQPLFSLKDGLDNTVKWFGNNMKL